MCYQTFVLYICRHCVLTCKEACKPTLATLGAVYREVNALKQSVVQQMLDRLNESGAPPTSELHSVFDVIEVTAVNGIVPNSPRGLLTEVSLLSTQVWSSTATTKHFHSSAIKAMTKID